MSISTKIDFTKGKPAIKEELDSLICLLEKVSRYNVLFFLTFYTYFTLWRQYLQDRLDAPMKWQ